MSIQLDVSAQIKNFEDNPIEIGPQKYLTIGEGLLNNLAQKRGGDENSQDMTTSLGFRIGHSCKNNKPCAIEPETEGEYLLRIINDNTANFPDFIKRQLYKKLKEQLDSKKLLPVAAS